MKRTTALLTASLLLISTAASLAAETQFSVGQSSPKPSPTPASFSVGSATTLPSPKASSKTATAAPTDAAADGRATFSVGAQTTAAKTTNAAATQAQTPSTSTGGRRIDYSQIPALVTSNLDVIKSKNAYQSAIASTMDTDESLADALDSYDETVWKFASSKDQLYAQYAAGLLTDEIYTEQRAALDAQEDAALEGIDKQIEQLQKARNNTLYQQETASLRIVSTQRSMTDAAQAAFLGYHSLNEKLLAAKKQLEYLEWQEGLAKTKRAKNLISQDAYNKAFDALRPQKDAIDTIVTNLRKNELGFKTAVGLPLTTAISFGELPALDVGAIPLRSRDADCDTYVKHSIDIQNAVAAARKANLDLYNDDVNGFDRDNANLSYEQTVEKAKSEFEASYDALQDAYKTYQNTGKAHQDKLKELTKLNVKYDKGIASKNAVLSQEYAVYQSERNLKAAQIDLYSQFQKYLNGLYL